jgi:predicted MFS family arabinose efflux permease
MTLPTRLIQSVRPHASAGLLGGAAVVAAVFAASPFLLPDVSTRLGVPLAVTGLLSTFQVATFAVAAFLAGRLFRPSRMFHFLGLALVAMACFAAALTTDFAVLLATRLLSGLGLGLLTWIAWAEAMRFRTGLFEVAAVAPFTAVIASPVWGWLIGLGGYRLIFAVLGVVALAAYLLPVDFGDLPRIGRSVSGSKSNRLLLVALLVTSMGGSAVFIFSAAAGVEVHGLTPLAVSWGLSINALTGFLATRLRATTRRAGIWMGFTALSALVLGTVGSPWVFFTVMVVWGFAFWMAIPAVFILLADKSLTPSERVGDAQAMMALGRVAGPILGGIALGAGQFERLSLVGGVVMIMAAAGVATVARYRSRPSGAASSVL